MLLTAFTLVHVAISLVGIVCGFVVVFGLLKARPLEGWTTLFLATTVATSVTGFMLPVHRFMPSHAVGIVSLLMLSAAIFARNVRRLAGPWRPTYVITAVISLWLNVFVLIAQSFAKVPALKALAPTQSEPPFLVAQLALLAIFIVLGVIAVKRFRDESRSLDPSTVGVA